MKKRILSMLVILCMVFAIAPTMAFADIKTTFANGDVIGRTTITEDTIWTIPEGVVVSITGNICVKNGATLTLNGGGTLLCKVANLSYEEEYNLFYIKEDARIVLNGVTLDGNRQNYFELVGIRVQDGTCIMNSGTIQNFSRIRYGAAIFVNRTYIPEENIDLLGTFILNGGTIQGNVTYDAFQKQGGSGIYNMGVVEIKGGLITGNSSAAAGGGIYNGSEGVMTILGGTITGNTSTKVDVNGTVMGNGIFNSSNDSTNSVLTIDGKATIDDVYLDNTTGDKVLFIQSALRTPLIIDSLNINEGKVLAEGKYYTLTAADMAKISCGVKNAYLGLNKFDNQIFLTHRTEEAYYPVTILSDNPSLKVEVHQDGSKVTDLLYQDDPPGYVGNLKTGTYDIIVNGMDVGKDIVVSDTSDNIFDSSYLEMGVEGDKTHVHGLCGHAGSSACPDGTNHNTHAVTGSWIPVSDFAGLQAMKDGKNYFLTENITTDERLEISGTINLCLNGHTLKSTVYHESFSNLNCAVYLNDNTTFNVSDCQGTGSIKNTAGMTVATATFGENIILNLFGGSIESASKSAYFNQEASFNCVFNQYGGTVKSSATGQTPTVNLLYGVGKYNLFGGTVQNVSDELAVCATSDRTQIALKGNFNVIGKIKTYNPIIIAGALSMPATPRTVILGTETGTGTFTKGWETYLPFAEPYKYFVPINPSYGINKDVDTGELKIEGIQTPVTPIDGTVTISGTQTSGNTLTAVYVGNAGDNVTYMWYRDGVFDITGASSNGNTYILGPDDIGKVITVTVSGKDPYTGTLTASTGVIQSALITTYTISFDANGGSGTMRTLDYMVGEYTLPENGFTAPEGKQFKAWSINGEEKAVGETINITADTTLVAVWEDIPPAVVYVITFHPNGGTVTPTTGTTNAAGKLISLPTPQRTGGYTFDGWYTVANGGTKITTDTVFTMNATIYAQWNYTGDLGGGGGGVGVGGLGGVGGGGGGGAVGTKYTITFETNGGSAIAKQLVAKNAKLAEPTAPTKDGFTFDGWYTDKELEASYDFDKAVTKNFTLYAKWVEGQDGSGNGSGSGSGSGNGSGSHYCPSKAFEDLDVTAWYHLDTDYVIQEGLMNGTEKTIFAPNEALTRAMLVTILYRSEGKPATNRSIPFADIDMNEYYANAVIWAKQNDIVKGISETEFAPDSNITREQIATILFRFAQYKGMELITLEENLHFEDADEISDYAISAMNWAVGIGLIKGKSETTLNPKDNATRAEIAALLHRFLETI